MAFVIFNNHNDVYNIADNENYLNNLNIIKSDYKIISISNENFNFIRLNQKSISLNNGEIVYKNLTNSFTKESLTFYVKNYINKINDFLENNPNHLFFQLWKDYQIVLKSLNLNDIQYPLNKSLEEHLEQSGTIALNPLQLP